MEVKKPNKVYQSYYEDIMLKPRKLRYANGCYVITIPKHIVEAARLLKNSHVGVCLFIRRKKFHDELAEDEKWVKMSKREQIMFEEWLKQRKDYMEKP